MAHTVTVTSSRSWLGRLGESIKSVLVGLVMFVASFPLLFWNEGRAVTTARSLSEGAGAVVAVAADRIDPGNEGKLVHVAGPIATDGPVRDPELGIEAQGVRLLRKVEMYQWQEESKTETRKKLGGGEERVTTYTYRQGWSEGVTDSSSFAEPAGHENPEQMAIDSESFVADPVRLGAFVLAADQVERLSTTHDVPATAAHADGAAGELAGSLTASAGKLYHAVDPAAPEVGDLRISFQVVDPAAASIVGVQRGDGFAPYQAAAGGSVLLIDDGMRSAPEMFQSAQRANTVLTWVLRFVGWLLMFLGLLFTFRPIAVFADVVPLFGTLLGAGLGFFSFLTASALSAITVAIAWIFFRPLLGIALLVLAGVALYLVLARGRKRLAQRAAAPAPLPA